MSGKLKYLAVLTLAATPLFAKTDALSLIPNDAVSVGVIRFADMRSSPLSSTLFQQTDKFSSHGEADKFLTDAGLQPTKDVDVLVVSTSPVTNLGTSARVLVAADGRFNQDRLVKALVDRGAVQKSSPAGNYLLFPEGDSKTADDRGAVAFPDGHLVLAGTESAVVKALADRAAGGTSFAGASGLGRDMVRIDARATAWAIVDVARASRLAGAPHLGSGSGPEGTMFAALKNVSTVAMWATDAGDSVRLNAIGLTHDEETLGLLEDTIRGGLSALRLAAQDKSPELVTVLRRFSVVRTKDSIAISGTIPAEQVKSFMATHHHDHQEATR